MCDTVMVDGTEIDNTKELSETLGVPVMMLVDAIVPDPDGSCLCNCDVEAMAHAAGRVAKSKSDDAFIRFVIDH